MEVQREKVDLLTSVIVMISGKQGSGKTTLSGRLEKELSLSVPLKFAGIIYKAHDAVRDVLRNAGIPAPEKDGTFLQWLGTEHGRNVYGENVWVDAVKHQCDSILSRKLTDCIIIDDLRFPNELELDSEHAQVIRIRLEASEETRKARCPAWRNNTAHISETALDGSLDRFDLVLDADNLNEYEVFETALAKITKVSSGE